MATQLERSASTRARLLEATIEALVEDGYAATTTTVIAERAGVSRGAQLHHYPTKAELVAAAVEYVATKLVDQFATSLGELDDNRIEFVIDAMWSSFTAPMLTAWVELSVVARSDRELRERLTPVADRLRDTILDRAGPRVTADALLVITMTLLLLEGVTLDRRSAVGGDRTVELAPIVLDTWKRMVRATFPKL